MKIAIDLDGVCYEWDKTARYLMRAYRGYSADGPMGTDSKHWDYIQENVSEQDWEWLWSEGVQLGLFRYGHLVQGAVIGLRRLAEFAELTAVTHRPSQAVRDTMAWLSLMDLPWSNVVLLTNGEPKSVVDAEYLIDDKPQNIEEWEAAGRTGLLFDRPWNDGYASRIRVFGWPSATQVLEVVDHEL